MTQISLLPVDTEAVVRRASADLVDANKTAERATAAAVDAFDAYRRALENHFLATVNTKENDADPHAA